MGEKIVFIAYYFSKDDGVASLRSKSLARLLEERNNKLIYITKETFGKKARDNKLIWSVMFLLKMLTTNYDSVYVSCGPFWHLRFILLLSYIKRKDFVVDFRDPWSINLKTGYGNSKPVAKAEIIERAESTEKKLYRCCHRFWVCTPGMKAYYANLFGDDSKISVVLNGHSLDDAILHAEPRKKSEGTEKVNYICLGKFAEYGLERAENTFRKIKKCCEQDHVDYMIRFVGANKESLEAVIEKLEMQDHVEFIPRLPYEEAIKVASESDVGLCIVRDEEIEFGTKIFDYLGLGLPIFDAFEKGTSIYNTFEKYLTTSKKFTLDMEVRKKYKRENLFDIYLSEIDN